MQIKARGPNGEECYVVSLCRRHHERQHEIGEAKFWSDYGYSPIEIIAKAQAFYLYSGDEEVGDKIAMNR